MTVTAYVSMDVIGLFHEFGQTGPEICKRANVGATDDCAFGTAPGMVADGRGGRTRRTAAGAEGGRGKLSDVLQGPRRAVFAGCSYDDLCIH